MSLIFLIGLIFMIVNSVLFSGRSRVIRYCFVAILFILFVYVTMDPSLTFDTTIYNFYYNNPDLAHFEIGYIYLMKFSNWLGFSFYQFRGLLFLLELIFISIASHRFHLKNINLFFLLYTILNFFESPVQLRNYLMATIIFLGFSFIKNRTLVGYIIFIALVGLGATIQSAGLFFLPFVFFFAFQGKTMDKIVIGYTLLFILLIVFGPIRSILSSVVGQILSPFGVTGMKAASYLNRLTPGQIILTDIPFTLGIWHYFSNYSRTIENKKVKTTDYLSENILVVEKLFFFLIYMFPMYLFAYNFNRILIDSFLIFFVGIVTLSDNSREFERRGIRFDKYAVIGIVTTSMYAVFSYTYGAKFVGTFMAILFHNIFFGGDY